MSLLDDADWPASARVNMVALAFVALVCGLWGTGQYVALGHRADEVRTLTRTIDTQHRDVLRLRGMLEEAMLRGGCFLPNQAIDLTKVWIQRGGQVLLEQPDGGWRPPEAVITVYPSNFMCGLVRRGQSDCCWDDPRNIGQPHWECAPAPEGLTAADMESAHE